MKETAYAADKVFTGEEWLTGHAIVVTGDAIEAMEPVAALDETYEVHYFSNAFIAPAFIDIQIYGAQGRLLAVHPDAEALALLHQYCFSGGAPLCVPTVATNTIEVFKQCIDAVKRYWQGGGKGIYGLHLEGPWINPVKRGAHIEALIHPPRIEEVKELLAYGEDVIKIITLAPEVCSSDIVELIQQQGIIVSAGHSNATYAEATAAFDKGITTATHLYNAMSPLGHRAPGMVGALFNHATAMCSIIPDGHHVDYAAIAIAKREMKERLFVITDAVTETTTGHYRHQLAGDKYESGGILSGSALTMHAAFVNLVNEVAISVAEALRMCSLYPARVLRQEHIYGKIAPGYKAQLVVIGNDLKLGNVISAPQALSE